MATIYNKHCLCLPSNASRLLPVPFSSRTAKLRCRSLGQQQELQQQKIGQTYCRSRVQPFDQRSQQLLSAAARIACIGAAAALCLFDVGAAEAAVRRQPPITESAGRCEIAALDKFADVSKCCALDTVAESVHISAISGTPAVSYVLYRLHFSGNSSMNDPCCLFQTCGSHTYTPHHCGSKCNTH